MATTAQDGDRQQLRRLRRTPKGRIMLIVVASLAAGLVAAFALVAAPFIPARENVLTGVVLLAFAFGWVMLAVLSVRLPTSPSAGPPRRPCSSRWPASSHSWVRGPEQCLGLDMAANTVRARSVDCHSCTPAAAQPSPAVAAVPAAGGVGAGLGGRRLPNHTGVKRRDRLPNARPTHRCRWAPATGPALVP
jgi:hypothetical protein